MLFILCDVCLVGVDFVMVLCEKCIVVWDWLVKDLDLNKFDLMMEIILFGGVEVVVKEIFVGKIWGCMVVDVNV